MATVDDLRGLISANAVRVNEIRQLDDAMRSVFDKPYLPLDSQSRLATEYNQLITRSETNVCEMMVEATSNRLKVTGIRTDETSEPDMAVWGWWKRSRLNQTQKLLWRDALGLGDGFLLVSTDDDFGPDPRFTVESPLQIFPEYDPYDPMRVSRAVKVVGKYGWYYDDELIWPFYRDGRHSTQWEPAGDPIPHGGGECPIVRFPNKVDSLGRSESEIDKVLPIQARINQSLFDRLLVQRHQSWRQMAVTGATIQRDGDGKPIMPFEVGANRLLADENPDARFYSFPEATLDGLLKSIQEDIAAAAMVTATPPQYLPQASISSVSQEALVALEAAFVAKVDDRQAVFGESVERAMMIGGRMVGYEVPVSVETIWAELQLRSLAQKVDAATKLRSIGFPMRYIMETLGMTEDAIRRNLAEIERETNERARAEASAFNIAPQMSDSDMDDGESQPIS